MHDHNPYLPWIKQQASLLRAGVALGAPSGVNNKLLGVPNAPRVMLFSPHPDDECIVAGLPLRLGKECGCRITNVAITLGSDFKRRQQRRLELIQACAYLGFECRIADDDGFDDINPDSRRQHARHWQRCVQWVSALLAKETPNLVLFPHVGDLHPTHQGVHLLLMDALEQQSKDFTCEVLETEFWGPMSAPNLLVESSEEDLACIVAALSLHRGEVQRNPYHARLPAWMIDNVRRGSELISGAGSAAPDVSFATLYRHRSWRNGEFAAAPDGRLLESSSTAASLSEHLLRANR